MTTLPNRLLFFSVLGCSLSSAIMGQQGLVIDVAAIERARVLKAAGQFLHELPVTITSFPSPRSAGGLNEFFSEGDYWWPDPGKPDGPYIQRDGMTNPDNFVAHRLALLHFSRTVSTLAATCKVTGERKYAIAAVTSGPAIQLIAAIVLSAIVYIASLQASTGVLTVGEFISFFAAMTMLMTPLKRLVGINEFIQKGLAACESIFGLLDQPAEIDQGARQIERAKGAIELQDISFRYNPEDPEALSHISLVIRPGETVALVGPSGSGKTTIANLLPGFYLDAQGKILIDGIEIREYTLESLRANIALVSQDVVLFNDTLRNNIAYGAMRNCSDNEIEDAASSAHAMEFIRELPEGFDTIIGERGLRLSGGQRQRLAIARALLKNAPILILDEATSSLDTESERHIQAALETLRKGRTCIIIAHRLSTIENADRIIVIEQGKIVQTGTHAELIRREGVYARLHQVDFAESA